MAKSIPTTVRLSKRNVPNAMRCERCFLSIILILLFSVKHYLFRADTASTVKLISKLIKNNTTPRRNKAS